MKTHKVIETGSKFTGSFFTGTFEGCQNYCNKNNGTKGMYFELIVVTL